MKKTHRIAPEVREQILKRIKEEGDSVAQAAKEHGISDVMIYRWLGKGLKEAPTLGNWCASNGRTRSSSHWWENSPCTSPDPKKRIDPEAEGNQDTACREDGHLPCVSVLCLKAASQRLETQGTDRIRSLRTSLIRVPADCPARAHQQETSAAGHEALRTQGIPETREEATKEGRCRPHLPQYLEDDDTFKTQ